MTKARDVSGTPEVVLSSGSFTSVASVSISNALTDTYRFYQLNLYGTTTGDFAINLRFRESTTDVTTSYLRTGFYGTFGGSSSTYYASSNTGNLVTTAATSTLAVSEIKIFRPDATQGFMSGTFVDRANNGVGVTGGYRTGMTNFNGITIYPNGGTFTGYYILTGRRV